MPENDSLQLIKRIKSLADTGLVYVEDDYDKDRYEEIREISLQLLETVSGQPLQALGDFFMPVKDYPTVKVDVRGFILNYAHEILMVKESIDGKWTIPGGWADIGYSPSEVAIKEVKEETGLKAEVVRLLAIYDKKCHPHPPEPYYIYKLMFLCKVVGGELNHGFDMQGVGYFPLDRLPELSKDRILKSQLEQLYAMALENENEVYYD